MNTLKERQLDLAVLSSWMRENSVSQKALSIMIGCTHYTVCRIMKQRQKASPRFILSLVDATGLTLDQITRQ